MIRRGWLFWGTAIAVLGSARVGFAGDCRQSCIGSIPCHVEVTNCLIESGRTRDAIDRLKEVGKCRRGIPRGHRGVASFESPRESRVD